MQKRGSCDYINCSFNVYRNSAHCIFHKLEKKTQKERVKFYEELLNVNKGKVTSRHLTFEDKNVNYFYFPDGLYAVGYKFPPVPRSFKVNSFRYAKIDGKAWLNNAEFKNHLPHFDYSEFGDSLDFMHVTFHQGAHFLNARFKGPAYFSGADFFGSVDFRKATFENDVNFEKTYFSEGAIFKGTKFLEDCSFTSGSFKRIAVFKGSLFNGELDFEDTNFLEGIHLANRQDIEDGIKVSFYEEIENPLTYSDFFQLPRGPLDPQMRFGSPSTGILALLYQNRGKWKTIQASIVQLSTFQKENWERFKEKFKYLIWNKAKIVLIARRWTFHNVKMFQKPSAKEAGCKQQRISKERQGKREEADTMYLHEMRAKRKKLLEERIAAHEGELSEHFADEEKSCLEACWRKITDWKFFWNLAEKPLIDSTCRYGTSIAKVITFSASTMLISAILYWFSKVFIVKASVASEPNIGGKFIDSLYQSVLTFSTLGYGYMEPDHWFLKLVSSVESLLGAFFTALLVVVFARKWMR